MDDQVAKVTGSQQTSTKSYEFQADFVSLLLENKKCRRYGLMVLRPIQLHTSESRNMYSSTEELAWPCTARFTRDSIPHSNAYYALYTYQRQNAENTNHFTSKDRAERRGFHTTRECKKTPHFFPYFISQNKPYTQMAQVRWVT